MCNGTWRVTQLTLPMTRPLQKPTARYVTRDPNVFYAPPPSLQRMQYVAFAVTRDGSATDAPRFMLYAQNQAELDAKIAYVAENHKMYGVVRQSDVSSYKK